ncbi:MAG: hypothetical protein KF897_14150 [Opitutaceae bacterium]|nr:hypothetical protein [Opitutaceae bacterium]
MNSNSAATYREPGCAIYNLSWRGNEELEFLGTGQVGVSEGPLTAGANDLGESTTGLYRYHIGSDELQRLTDPRCELGDKTSGRARYDIQRDTVLFATDRETNRAPGLRRQFLPSGYDNEPLQFVRGGGGWGGGVLPLISGRIKLREFFLCVNGGPAKSLTPHGFASRNEVAIMKLSPDAKWAVVSVLCDEVVPGWEQYDGLDAPYSLLPMGIYERVQRLLLINTKTGCATPFWDAPLGHFVDGVDGQYPATVFWSPDSKNLMLVNVCLPAKSSAVSEEDRLRNGYMVSYEIETGKWEILQPMRDPLAPDLVPWLEHSETSGEIVFKRLERKGRGDARPVASTILGFRAGRWEQRPADLSYRISTPRLPLGLSRGLRVFVKQDLNTPPVLAATDGRREVILIGRDPSIASVRVSPRTLFMLYGKVMGVLTLPTAEPRAAPLPLVVQMYVSDVEANMFGPETNHLRAKALNSHASQALAAEGMAVLDLVVGDYGVDKLAGTLEPARAATILDDAVAALSAEGIVDPNRVGIAGFSNGGGQVLWAIANHGKVTPSAAIADDSICHRPG